MKHSEAGRVETGRSTRQRWAAIAAAAAVAVGGGAFAMVSASDTTASSFVPIAPCRLLDTRPSTNVGPRNTPITAGESLTVAVWGNQGDCVIPETATAIVINVTVTQPTAPQSFLTVYPADVVLPTASNLNYVAGQSPTPNLVTVSLSATGAIKIFNKNGTVNVIGDIAGYYQPDSGTANADDECLIGGLRGYVITGVDHEHNMSSKCFTSLVSTLAGSDAIGSDDYPFAAAFNAPHGLAVDSVGNIYVADANNNKIRKVTRTGVVTTLATVNSPQAVAVDAAGNVFAALSSTHQIVKIFPNGLVTAFAGTGVAGFVNGPGASARFSSPYGLAIDTDGNLYVADLGNAAIRSITSLGVVSTLAGTGVAGFADGILSVAQFDQPTGVAVDSDGNVYVGDFGNHRIRKITSTAVTTLAGSGTPDFADNETGSLAEFDGPAGVAVDGDGNVYVADTNNQRIRKITVTGAVSTIAGSSLFGFADGVGVQATFNNPSGVAIDTAGTIYVADTSNHRIRRIN